MIYAIIASGIVTNIVEWDGVFFNPGSPGIPEVPPDDNGQGGSPAVPPVPAHGWSPPDGSRAVLVNAGECPQIGLGYANGVYAQLIQAN